MTFGELKALIANFEAVDDEMKIVINEANTRKLVELDLHNAEYYASVIGRDRNNNQVPISNANEKVLRVHVITE